jgi:hypothetical protein
MSYSFLFLRRQIRNKLNLAVMPATTILTSYNLDTKFSSMVLWKLEIFQSSRILRSTIQRWNSLTMLYLFSTEEITYLEQR